MRYCSLRRCATCGREHYPRVGDALFKSCAGCRVRNGMMTLYRLFVWAANQIGSLDPIKVRDFLACPSKGSKGGIQYVNEPSEAAEAIRVFRRLRKVERLKRARRHLRDAWRTNDPNLDAKLLALDAFPG